MNFLYKRININYKKTIEIIRIIINKWMFLQKPLKKALENVKLDIFSFNKANKLH